MATRADVAKIAGVSESTVSYVISGKRPISEPTKNRVLAAIKKSGYKSNYAAAALAGGSPRMVTLMISNLFTTPPRESMEPSSMELSTQFESQVFIALSGQFPMMMMLMLIYSFAQIFPVV